jgi:hypothetical protein
MAWYTACSSSNGLNPEHGLWLSRKGDDGFSVKDPMAFQQGMQVFGVLVHHDIGTWNMDSEPVGQEFVGLLTAL